MLETVKSSPFKLLSTCLGALRVIIAAPLNGREPNFGSTLGLDDFF